MFVYPYVCMDMNTQYVHKQFSIQTWEVRHILTRLHVKSGYAALNIIKYFTNSDSHSCEHAVCAVFAHFVQYTLGKVKHILMRL